LTFHALWERLRVAADHAKRRLSRSANQPALTVRIGMENFGLELIYAVGVNKPVCIKKSWRSY
jgi:hypothetical protein